MPTADLTVDYFDLPRLVIGHGAGGTNRDPGFR